MKKIWFLCGLLLLGAAFLFPLRAQEEILSVRGLRIVDAQKRGRILLLAEEEGPRLSLLSPDGKPRLILAVHDKTTLAAVCIYDTAGVLRASVGVAPTDWGETPVVVRYDERGQIMED